MASSSGTANASVPVANISLQPVSGSARTRSLVLAAYPWLNSKMITAASLTEVVPTDQLSRVLVESLDAYEKFLFKPQNDRYAGLQKVLQLQNTCFIPDPAVPPTKNDLLDMYAYAFQLATVDRLFGAKSIEQQRVGSSLAPVALPDASPRPASEPGVAPPHNEESGVAPVEGPVAAPIVPPVQAPAEDSGFSHVRSAELLSSCKQFNSKLENWTEVLRGAKVALETLSQLEPEEFDENSGIPPGLLIVQSLAATSKYTDLRNIRYNLDTAALHLLRLLTEMPEEGHLFEYKSGDMAVSAFEYSDGLAQSTQSDGTVAVNTNTHRQLTDDERVRIQQCFKRITTSLAALPLQSAMLLTPILLLCPTQLAHWNWNRLDILRTAKNMGNNAPPIIRKMETLILDCLMNIVRGRQSSLGALKTLIAKIDWDQLGAVDQHVAKYFATKTCDPPPVTKGFPLLTVNVSEDTLGRIPMWDEIIAEAGGYSVEGKFVESSPRTIANASNHEDDDDPTPNDNPTAPDNENNPATERDKDTPVPDKEPTPGPSGNKPVGRKSAQPTEPSPSKSPSPQHEVAKAKYLPRVLSTSWRPVDYDFLTQPLPTRTLVISEKPARHVEPDVGTWVGEVWGDKSQLIKIMPTAHDVDDIILIHEYMESAVHYHVDKLPMHLSDSKTNVALSAIYSVQSSLLTDDKLSYMDILQCQHIFITHHPPSVPIKFSIPSLVALRSFSSLTPITDYSVPEGNAARVRDGTIGDLFTCALDANAKILSAAGFPLTGSPWNEALHSTDYVAWRATQGMPFAMEGIPLPTSDFALGNAATSGAVFWWRFSPHGLGTVLKVKTGGLVLVIGRPRAPFDDKDSLVYRDYEVLGKTNLLVDLQENKGTNKNWITEAVYLGPGTEFVMRPSTPFFIYVAEKSIWETHYFYCSRLMHDSLRGIMLHFMYSTRYSQEYRPSYMKLIQRIIQFHYLAFIDEKLEDQDPAKAHLPILDEVESVADFLSLCALGILANVVDLRTYEVPDHITKLPNYRPNCDMNALLEEERVTYIHIRAQAYCLIDWFFHTRQVFVDHEALNESEAYMMLFAEPFARLWSTLYENAKALQEFHPDIPYTKIQEQLQFCCENDKGLSTLVNEGIPMQEFGWDYDKDLHFLFRESTGEPFNKCVDDYIDRAHTAGDDICFGTDHAPVEPVDDDEEVFGDDDEANDSDFRPPPYKASASKKPRRRSGSPSTDRPQKKRKVVNPTGVSQTSSKQLPKRKRK